MKMLFFTILFSLLTLNLHSQDSPKITFGSVVLYHPNEVLQRRVPNIQELANFMQDVNDSLQKNKDPFVGAGKQAGALVIALRPDGQKNVWFVFEQELSQKTKDLIKELIKKQKAPTVKEGVFVYGQWLALNGATITDTSVPAPKEWQAMAKQKNRSLETDEVINLCWQ